MLRHEILCPAYAVDPRMLDRLRNWLREEFPWWLCSFAFHLVLVCSLAMVGTKAIKQVIDEPPIDVFSAPTASSSLDLVPWNRDDTIMTPPPPDDTSPSLQPPRIEGGSAPAAPLDGGRPGTGGRAGGEGSFVGPSIPPAPPSGRPPIGRNPAGDGDKPWSGRTQDPRITLLPGRTIAGDQAVVAALNWLVRHQYPDGRWSLTAFNRCCRDAACTSPGKTDADSAATALALLPFLAAGHTHLSVGPLVDHKDPHRKAARDYRRAVNNGLYWLLRNQKPNGDLRAGSTMYAHGLATIALCEAYGMTNDRIVGAAAQRAVNFIEMAQNRNTGGWRSQPAAPDPGDTSVVGWQVMALKSGQMANLKVEPVVLERAKAFLRSVSAAQHGLFGYTPGAAPTATMTSVGLLCSQYLGVQRTDPALIEGTRFLMQSLPGDGPRDVYYLYYATQVMHNQPGPEWDVWNRKMRRTLLAAQDRDHCAAGSWNPEGPQADRWGVHGGRLMMTSLAALTLEVYYRHIPLYQLDRD
jgi:hypothetical protein